MDDAKFFFQSPLDKPVANPVGQAKHSTLSALRGDVDFCMGIDRSNGKPSPAARSRALWSGTITIMAGIDLLAKFYAGCDDTAPGKVGERFKTFVKNFLDGADEDADLLYQLRNSLMHSYSLSFRVSGCHVDLAFCQYPHLITPKHPDGKIVDLLILYREFEATIDKYHRAVESDVTLQAYFARMFLKYGSFFTYEPPPSTPAVES
jgi:hypothetical protein